MKITTFLLLVGCLQVSAASNAQNVTLVFKDAPLNEIFSALEKQTNYTFFCEYSLLQKARKVTIHVKDIPFKEALERCLKDQPLTYSFLKNTVLVKPLRFVSETGAATKANIIDVRGQIFNSDGEPVADATVSVQGSSQQTRTNLDGQFVIAGVQDNSVLVITHVQYETQLIYLNGRTSLKVNMQIKVSSLDELQVIAYGQTTKRLQTGNVSTVKAVDIAKQPVNNPILALEGRVPGLQIIPNNGLPGANIKVRIRGQNSISNGNEPLYIVDGVPYTSQLLPTVSDQLGDFRGGGSALNFVNPSDIESIDVLKDADATAIYGSRAANGAILITTKKGKAGKTKLDINLQSGWSSITTKLDILNTRQYLDMRYEAIKNDGLAIEPWDYDLFLWDTTRSTDWQKELLSGTAKYTDFQVSVSGGNASTQFLIGYGYHYETLIYPGDFSDRKNFVKFSVSNISNDKRFRIQLSGNYAIDRNQLPNVDLTSTAISLPPNAPPLFNDDGTLNWALDASGTNTWTNPLFYLYYRYKGKSNVLLSNAMVSYQLLPDLDIKTSFGYVNSQENQFRGRPVSAFPPNVQPNIKRSAEFANNNSQSWVIEPQIEYKKNISKGRLNLLIGSTIQQNDNNGQILHGEGFNSDFSMEDIKSAPIVLVYGNIKSTYKYNALFARIGYNWQDKYLLNLTGRRDGTSRFGPKSQFHNFGAVGMAWVFSKEKIIENNFNVLSHGKLRGSYGTTGSDQIPDYYFLDLFNPTTGGGVAYQGTSGLVINNLNNPYLAWEETKKTEVGLDLGFFHDKVLLTVSHFQNRSSNQLANYQLPAITGATSINKNLGATVKNSGFEFVLETKNLTGKNFQWNSSINLSFLRNKLQAVDSNMSDFYKKRVGQSLNTVNVFHFLGVDAATGKYQVADHHGVPTFAPDYETDATVYIDLSPKYFGSIQNEFVYKEFSLDFLVRLSKQIVNNSHFGNYPGSSNTNQPISVLDRWKKTGDDVSIQRFNSDWSIYDTYNIAASSDAAYSQNVFIRLQNLSFSWQIPRKWLKKMHSQNSRLYINGQNLWTFQSEKNIIYGYGVLRTITGGIQVTF